MTSVIVDAWLCETDGRWMEQDDEFSLMYTVNTDNRNITSMRAALTPLEAKLARIKHCLQGEITVIPTKALSTCNETVHVIWRSLTLPFLRASTLRQHSDIINVHDHGWSFLGRITLPISTTFVGQTANIAGSRCKVLAQALVQLVTSGQRTYNMLPVAVTDRMFWSEQVCDSHASGNRASNGMPSSSKRRPYVSLNSEVIGCLSAIIVGHVHEAPRTDRLNIMSHRVIYLTGKYEYKKKCKCCTTGSPKI
ncbi:hypothetical protein EDB19DRAFT_765654 [Suillus lakei]|nr:hypothetical protein EDB19DRAFT_765654 [Suillus lakei]